MVKEIAFLKGKFEPYVPEIVAEAIHKKLGF
jgi:phosphopantetheine adenylyltransferase